MELKIEIRGTIYDSELYTEDRLIGTPVAFNGKFLGDITRVDLENKYIYTEIDETSFNELFITNEPENDAKNYRLHFNMPKGDK